MTWISRRHRRPARSRRRALFGVVASMGVLFALFPLTVPEPAAAETLFVPTEVDEIIEIEPDPITITVVAGDHGEISDGSAATVSVSVRNDSEHETTTGRVSIEIARRPLSSGEALDDWLQRGASPAVLSAIAGGSVAAIPSGAEERLTVSVGAEQLDLPGPGVYPLRARTQGIAPSRVLEPLMRSVLIVSGGSDVVTSLVIPLTATAAGSGLLTSSELAELTAPEDGSLTAVLDAVTGSHAALAVDPSIVAAIRSLGSSAPTSAREWLRRLESLPNEMFLLQFADADPTTQAQAGLPQLLQPLALDPLLDPLNFSEETSGPSQNASPTPSESPSAPSKSTVPENEDSDSSGASSLPNLTDLTTLTNAASDILWPQGDANEEDIARFTDYIPAPAWTILPADRVVAPTSSHVRVNEHSVLLNSERAAALLSRAAVSDHTDEQAAYTSQARAALHIAAQGTEADAMMVGLERWKASPDGLVAVVTALERTEHLITLSELRQSPAVDVELTAPTDQTGSSRRAEALLSILTEESEIAAFASVLEDPLSLLSPQRLATLRLIGVGIDDEDFETALTQRHEDDRAILQSVSAQPPARVQLISTGSDLPVWVRNNLPWPVTVTLEARPSDGRLEVQRYTAVTVQGSSNIRVRVPVEARVGSGEVRVRFSLSSPTGVSIGGTESAHVTVRADWETIGISIFGAVIAVLLVFGVFRTILRRRRESVQEHHNSLSASHSENRSSGPEKLSEDR